MIHTGGPVWHGGGAGGEPNRLAACYRESLKLATDRLLASVAYPCISTGVYGYPHAAAAQSAVAAVRQALS